MKPPAPFPIPRSAAVSSSTSRSAWKYPAASDASQRSLVTKLLRLIPRRAGHSRAPESRQLVTVCNQLKSGVRSVRQSVTNCHRLKTGGVFITQPVTNCYRLKTSPNPRNLIPPP